jgi:hypothetical protein
MVDLFSPPDTYATYQGALLLKNEQLAKVAFMRQEDPRLDVEILWLMACFEIVEAARLIHELCNSRDVRPAWMQPSQTCE